MLAPSLLLLLLLRWRRKGKRLLLLLLLVMMRGNSEVPSYSINSVRRPPVQGRSTVVGDRVVLEVPVRRIPRQLEVSRSADGPYSSRGRQDLRPRPRSDSVLTPGSRHLERTASVALHLATSSRVQRGPLALGVVTPAAVARRVAGGNGGVVVGGEGVAGTKTVAIDNGLAMVVA